MTDARTRRLTNVANIRLPTEKAHGLQVGRMCEAFERLGVQTTLVHPRRHQPGTLRSVDPLRYYGVRHRFTIHTLPNIDVVRTEPWLPGRLYTVAHFAHGGLWAWHAARWAPADLFMARDVAIAAALVRLDLPTVLEIHQGPERWSLRLLKHVTTSPSLRTIVTMTQALRETLVSRGVVLPNSIVLPDGIDTNRYTCASETPWPDARPVVLYTGHLFREKGIETLVEAARLLAPDVAVKVAGGMPQHVAEWHRRVVEYGPDNVEFLGHLPPDRIPPLQKGADLLVLPNSGRHPHSARYTSPMKVFEYMAAGKPIVASDVPAIREVLRHSTNAWLVPPDDPAALADAIRALVADLALGRRLGHQARIDVRQYRWTRRAKALVKAAGYEVHAHP